MATGGRLGLVAATALVMGNMIGSGVFLLPASLAPYGWTAVIGWIATTAGAMVLAYVLTRLTSALPKAGGPAGFVSAAFGHSAGFFISWIYLVSIWTAVVTIAVAAISYLSSMVPALGNYPAFAAIVLLWLLALVNMRGVRTAGGFQVVTLALKILPLLVVAVLAVIVLWGGHAAPPAFVPGQVTFHAVNGAASLTLWALLGFESASVAAAKVERPEVNIARATLWGTGLAGVLYLLVCSAIGLLLPPDVVAQSPAPFATFVTRFWSPEIAGLIAIFAVISCVGAVNGWTLLEAEMVRDMAARRMLPEWFAAVDGRGTARRALLISTVIASLFAAMNTSRAMQALFEYLLLLSTSAALWLYLACALAALRLGVARIPALIGVLYSLWTLWGAGLAASGLSFVLMVLGLPIWLWLKHRKPVAANL
ncbi:amino acid permease [Novosphingobium album (ex Hu et al. 2023)]|uniref:Arginine/agmatine antiporter n=1 Tax=Novosphingobium album (ex Hu et al. 2023) TaxID=2930093 RepID=A0ABT0B587_9SPHN|nr:amino acid permease [Novosphingobium album (ex Hu et al. 2023)]MCJ2180033.1 amino acid permease [Novosphingobium album (ex Hu et al. 2023)]